MEVGRAFYEAPAELIGGEDLGRRDSRLLEGISLGVRINDGEFRAVLRCLRFSYGVERCFSFNERELGIPRLARGVVALEL